MTCPNCGSPHYSISIDGAEDCLSNHACPNHVSSGCERCSKFEVEAWSMWEAS